MAEKLLGIEMRGNANPDAGRKRARQMTKARPFAERRMKQAHYEQKAPDEMSGAFC
jgi:hypothetical protein